MKKCSKCHRKKRLSSFTNDKSRPDGKDYWCRICKNKLGKVYRNTPRGKELAARRAVKWQKENPKRVKNNYLKRLYGITLEDRNKMFKKQGKRCAICKKKKSGYPGWVMDHDHKTKRVRGILCNKCNLLLGRAEDNVKILISATKYLRKM